MSFPISPTNGQQTTVNGIQYVYSTTDNSWTRLTQSIGNVSVDLTNISSDVIPSANVTYDLGSSSNRWRDIWLSGNTIHLGEANISAVGNTISLPTNSLSSYTGNIGGASVVSGQTISVPAYVLTYGDPMETPGTDQWGSSLAFDSTGNLYIIGAIGTNIGEQVGIIKLDRTGTILQQKYLSNVVPNGYDPVGDAITVDNSGNVIIGVGGYGYNASVLKLNADLNTIFWSKGFYHQHTSGQPDQRVRDISVDSQNNIYVSVGDYAYYTNPPKLIKLDTNGTLIWQIKLNTIARGYQTAIDSQDNIYWVGQAAINNFADTNGFILKLDSTGSILWQYAIELNGYDNIQGVGVDSQDNVIICGVNQLGSWRLSLIKFDQNGNLLWQRFLEDFPQSVEGYSIAFDTDNNIYVSGVTYYNADILIVRYDTDGNLTWQRRLGTTADDWQWYDSSWRAIDIFGNCFAITGYNTFGDTTYQLIAAQLPIDGTLIGNVDQWSYTATTFANVEASYTPNNAGYTTETYSLTENTWTFEFSDVTTLTTNVVSYGNIVESSVTTTSLAADNIFVKTINLETEILWANGNTYGSSITLESISSNLIPTANVTYDIGSSDNRWKDLWLSGNTIHLGQANLTATGTTVNIGYLETTTTGSFVPANLTIDPNNMYDIGPSFTLSNNNTTITALSTQPTDCIALGSNVILQNEKIVFSTRMDAGPARVDYLMLGVARGNVVQSDYPGQDAVTSVGFSDDGNFYEFPSIQGGYPTYGAGDIVDIAVDRVNHLIWYRVNGGYWNGNVAADPATATGNLSISQYADATELYPIYSPYYNGQADQMTILNTATYTLPAGFTLLGESNTLATQTTYSGSVVTANLVANVVYTEYISSDVIPSANVTYDLGSSTNRWRDLYLSGNSLYIGDAVISAAGNAVNLPAGSTIQGALIIGNVTFDGNTIKPAIDAPLTIRTEYSYQPYWAQTLVGSNTEYGQSVTTDSNNNIYVCGVTNSVGRQDLLLVKFDSSGNLIWQKVSGRVWSDSGRSVTIDSTDNIYVCGYAFNPSYSRNDLVLDKFDTSGNIVWQKTFGQAGVSWSGQSVTTNSNNDVYVCGYAQYINGSSNYDLLLAKFDTSGNIVWQKVLGESSTSEEGWRVTTDISGNIYVSGYTLSQAGGGGFELSLAKFDTSGNVVWQRIFSGYYSEFGTEVTTDSTGNIYVCGYTDSQGVGSQDLLLAKFDIDGNIVWQKLLGGVSTEYGYSVTTDSMDNVYVCGDSSSITDTNPIRYNAVIVKYDSSGTVLWQRGFGRTNTEYEGAFGIAIDSNDDIIITGESGTTDPNYNADVLVVKLPNDGSGTGTHGIFDYYAITLTESTATFTANIGNLTVTNGTMSLSSNTSTVTDSSLVRSNFVNLPGIKVAGSNSWIFGADGSLTFPDNTVQTTASSAANQETLTTFTNATGNVTHDYTLGSTFYHSNVSSNFTANFINVPITNNQKISVDLIINQGATPNIANLIQINGNIPTIRWTTITAPTGLASNVDIISFNLLRVSNDWIVTGSLTSYGYIL